MLRFALIVSLFCAMFVFGPTPSAQQPKITGQAARIAKQPLATLINPVQRAQLASRLAAAPIDPAEISEPVRVSVLSPIVGDPNAPTLALSGYGVSEWRTLGAEPRMFLDRRVARSWARLTLQLSAGHRHLVICDLQSRSFETRDATWAYIITWEGSNRGAILLPATTAEGRRYIDLYPISENAWLSSCEVSRIG